ncbi:putative F-box domain-containing protein [Rosellinia necatrix]|uniref:Putative F-box domain-containing protein n=1 Tax=Rosellinia necatrix TaxID=77044 RepID=A0A1S7UMW9_ROSNE|nr:putative F-box domain-containing protein [Rosellinia necatrix]
MDLIPSEILLHIFGYIDGPAPSDSGLHDQPRIESLTMRPGWLEPPLKAASLVSRSWRCLVLSRLFTRILWKPDVFTLTGFTFDPIPLLRFLVDNRLERGVVTFTMIVDFFDPANMDYQFASQIRTTDLEWLWDQLFSVIDPLRFTILARPTTLATLLSRRSYFDDGWPFNTPYHILSLARVTRQAMAKDSSGHIQRPTGSQIQLENSEDSASMGSGPITPTAPAPSSASRRPATYLPLRLGIASRCPLLTIRPWTSLLLNEGSSAKVYYECLPFLCRLPSILSILLGCERYPSTAPLIPQTVVDFNYIAIFPRPSHFEILLQYLPRINRLFVQLAPKPENGILENTNEMEHINPAEMWKELNTSYNFLMRKLTTVPNPRANWSFLRVFESGDAVGAGAWGAVIQILENSSIREWKVERQGVLVRHLGSDELSDGSSEVNDDVGNFSNASYLMTA